MNSAILITNQNSTGLEGLFIKKKNKTTTELKAMIRAWYVKLDSRLLASRNSRRFISNNLHHVILEPRSMKIKEGHYV